MTKPVAIEYQQCLTVVDATVHGNNNLNEGVVLLADTFFPSYFLVCTLQMMGEDYQCEQMGGRKRKCAAPRPTRSRI